MEWENSRRQTEQYQHDIDIWRRQLDEATDALSRANEEREFMGGQMENLFAVRVTSLSC
jgi:predicted  nucleic acid-binding Zn-ribbon protein